MEERIKGYMELFEIGREEAIKQIEEDDIYIQNFNEDDFFPDEVWTDDI